MSRYRSVLRKSLTALASVCDHARQRDNVGFSASTVVRGHEVATLPDRFWSEAIDVAAAVLVLKHEKQLVKAEAVDPLDLVEVRAYFGDRDSLADIPDRWIEHDPALGVFLCSVTDRWLRDRLRSVPGAEQPAGKGKIWVVPFASGYVFSDATQDYDVSDDTSAMIGAARAAADPDDLCRMSDKVVSATGQDFVVSFPYDPGMVESVKEDGAARWDATGKSWTVAGSADGHRTISRLRQEFGFELTRDARALMEAGPVAGEAVQNGRRSPTLRVEDVGDTVLVSMSRFVEEWVEIVKFLPKSERRWDQQAKAWRVERTTENLQVLRDALAFAQTRPSERDLEALDLQISRTVLTYR